MAVILIGMAGVFFYLVSSINDHISIDSGLSLAGSMGKMDLTEDQTKILKALNTLTEPAGCKVIGEAADMPWRSVMAKLRGLKKEELVESPDKGVYIISEKGKEAIV